MTLACGSVRAFGVTAFTPSRLKSLWRAKPAKVPGLYPDAASGNRPSLLPGCYGQAIEYQHCSLMDYDKTRPALQTALSWQDNLVPSTGTLPSRINFKIQQPGHITHICKSRMPSLNQNLQKSVILPTINKIIVNSLLNWNGFNGNK